MKKIWIFTIAILLAGLMNATDSKAQTIADAIQQLALDYQKLAGLKSTLQEMYKGYDMISKGYNSVKNISKGSFDLHDAFLNGLMVVSPTVRKYPRVKDIICDQTTLISEYKSAYGSFKQDKHITTDEISYMTDVYNSLISQSLENINELSLVMADNKLRMSDNERLQMIDHIYATGHEQLTFLRSFNAQAQSVALERATDNNDHEAVKKLYGIQ
ncbi:hypothetical protein BDD43_0815 [Mucilaginibacter gracilis]|uniref:TerB family tellurite resistance protein n=1 Tax=Mucilaginibacter gracilis TaxID=423350 RepID=A0A495IW16_9SPHI|nr:TerB family tellurite resistance protein [Mucilaginibacter gracilis]RKR80683.1 hypothetical protein BDD43_0815 [Mucilaginibacter gracilis]